MSQQFSSGPVVLILEDEAIIAVNLQEELQEAGYAVGGPFTTCAEALLWLGRNCRQLALLFSVLRDGSWRGVALQLTRREVWFLIYSGHRADRALEA